MKPCSRILALILIVSLFLSVCLPVGALSILPPRYQGLSRPVSLYWDYYIFPFADVNDATVTQGSSRTLRFTSYSYESSLSPHDYFCVAIYRGSIKQLSEQSNSGKEPEVIDFFYMSGSEFLNYHGREMEVNWTADTRYGAGDYSVVCYLMNAETGKIYDDRSLYWADLHVVKKQQPSTGIGLWAITEDGCYEITENSVFHVRDTRTYYLAVLPEPLSSTDTVKNCKVYYTPSALVDAEMTDGYLEIHAKNIGMSHITVVCGTIRKSFWLFVHDHHDITKVADEAKLLGLYCDKTVLCTGEEETCHVKLKNAGDYPGTYPCAALWSSSDPSVATVGTRGEVKALKPGKVRITAVSGSFTDTVELTVQYHTLPEGTPESVRTATQPRQSIGHCSVCGKDNCVNIYEPAIFTDTKATAWYAEHVDNVYDRGLMNGVGEHTFAPNANVNRAMAATVLYRIAGKPEVEGDSPFSDVPEGKYYTRAVIWAEQLGVITGYPDGTFRPNDSITREQLAAVLYRYTAATNPEYAKNGYLHGYPDQDRVHEYAQKAVGWAVVNGLIQGVGSDGKTYLKPQDNATRAQFATIISRYLALIESLTPASNSASA